MFFDRGSKGYISTNDIKYALLEFGVEEDLVRSKYIELICEQYVDTTCNPDKYTMKYSDYCSMMLPKDKTYANLAINRMPVYSDYYNQHNNQEKRSHKELTGHTYKLLLDMIKEMFETMMVNLDQMYSKRGDRTSRLATTGALTELDTNV